MVRFFAIRVSPALLLALASLVRGQQPSSLDQLVRQFERETVFWRQFEVAQAIVAANDSSVLPRLEPWLTHKDRSLRGNAAYIFGRLGDPRGFDVIVAILADRSANREIHATASVGGPSLYGQIRQDRYYAAHLLGDLKDPRAIPILVPLLTDPDVNYIVPVVPCADWQRIGDSTLDRSIERSKSEHTGPRNLRSGRS